MKRALTAELTLAVFCLCSAVASASEQARITRSLEQHYNRLRSFEARFVQRYTLGRLTRVESGTVYFQKPGKMRWDYDAPEEKTFLADGRLLYLYVPAEGRVSRSRLSEAGDWPAALRLLFGRVEFGKLFARVEVKQTLRTGQPGLTQLRGLPKSADQGFREIWLDLNPRGQLERIEVRQHDGGLMEFHFRSWREDPRLPRKLFRLRVPPGTITVDAAATR